MIVFEQMQAALHHRTVVVQAKGVLAETGSLDMNQACTRLRDYARVHRLRLSEVDRDIATGALGTAEILIQAARADTPRRS